MTKRVNKPTVNSGKGAEIETRGFGVNLCLILGIKVHDLLVIIHVINNAVRIVAILIGDNATRESAVSYSMVVHTS
jgi:hypothetical protein